MGFGIMGQNVVTSTVVRYQLQFGHDINNLALVLYLKLLKKYWAPVVGLTYFKYSNNAKPCSLAAILPSTLYANRRDISRSKYLH